MLLLGVSLTLGIVPAAPAFARPAAEQGWVIYSTEFGWLRVGTQAEFEEPWEKQQEIWGGTSAEPLQKTLLRGGFASREEALGALCAELTRVRIKRQGLATPRWTTNALYKGEEYNLRLDRGLDADVVIWRGQEYDLQAEIAILREFGGITPRLVFSPQYLCHVYKRDTTEGPKELDEWMCQPNQPQEGGFWISDEIATFHHFYCDLWEGPFFDSFSLAQAMKRHGIESAGLWPPSAQVSVNAGEVPENPRDFGVRADAVQPLVREPQLLDWVIYATELGWLRIGTRTEFETPRPRSQEIWAGLSEEPIPKTLVAEGFGSYGQAVRTLCAGLSNVHWQYVRLNEPRWVVLGIYQGTEYHLQLVRDPDMLVVSGRGYDSDAERALLAHYGITLRLSFGEQWMVHSVRMGTYSGPRDTNQWMMVGGKPQGDTVAVPDGTGGWFIHTIDDSDGPFKDNYGLARALKARGLTSIGLAGGEPAVYADWVPDNPRDHGEMTPPSQPEITKVVPNRAQQGKEVFVTIVGRDIEYGAEVSFGEDIAVRNLTYFGRDPDSDAEQWLVTLTVSDDAKAGARDVTVRNYDGGQGVGQGVFEVIGVEVKLAPFLELVAPKSERSPNEAGECASLKAEHEQKVEEVKRIAKERAGVGEGADRDAELRRHWRRLRQAIEEMESTERLYWESVGQVIGDLSEDEIMTLVKSARARAAGLFLETRGRLDAWREADFSLFDETPYADRRQEYKDTEASLTHTLTLWKSLMAMLQERREFELQMARRARTLGEEADLRAPQQRLAVVHILQGEVSLLTGQTMVESGLQMQDSYGASLRETERQAERIAGQPNLSGDFLTEAAQQSVIVAKYFVGVGGTMFTGALDILQTWWNDTWFSNVWQFQTLTADIQKRINKSREEFGRKWQAAQSLHKMSPEDMVLMGRIIREDGPAGMGDDLAALDNDRTWVEDTDGSLLRLAACFDDTYPALMESEYRIMLRRAELSLRDMNRTLNLKMGADPQSGEFNRWKRLADPLGIVRTAFAEWMQDEFSSRIDFLGEREAELKLIRGLLPRLQRLDFDLGLLTYFPNDRATHYALQCKNPDYLAWCIKMRTLATKYREDLIERALQDAWEPEEIHALKRMRMLNRLTPLYPLKHEWARWLQLQGVDRLMMWDWAGALACYDQAAETDPTVQSPQGVQRLREVLGWQEAKEMGLDAFQQLGNQGMHAALFGILGRWGGEALRAGGIDLGMAAAEPGAIQAAESAGLLGRFGTAQYWGGFADFVWGQINPLAQLAGLQPEWDRIAAALKSTGQMAVETTLAGEISAKLLVGYFGMDKQYADFLANALVQVGSGAVRTRRELALEDAVRLNENTSRWQRLQVQIDLLRERADGRADVVRAIRTLEALRDADLARNQMELEAARRLATEWDFSQLRAKSQPLHEAEQQVRRQVEALTRERVESVSQVVLERLQQAKTQEERLQTLVAAMRDMPLESARALFRGNVQDPLSVQTDNFRREIQATMQSWFVEQFPQYAEYIIGYTTYGSAAHPDWPGYKRIWSDLDFTVLLKAGTPKEIREAVKRDFDAFFATKTGMAPEALDIHCFADEMPVFRSRLLWSAVVSEGTALSRALAENPALAQRVFDESSESLRLLWRNLVDPERYLLPGNLALFNYLTKMSGSMRAGKLVKVNEHFELSEDPANFDKVYGNVRFESWMGLDIVLDHLMHIGHNREALANDMFAYSKDLAKYSIRVLLGRIIQTPQGLERINNATAQEVAEAGGLEAFVVRVAKELPPRELGLLSGQAALLDEWIARKEARPFGEILQARNNGVRLSENDFRLNRLVARHINETERFLLESIGFTTATQAAYLRQLMSEAAGAADPTVRAALETKVREIVCSQAALWQRLRPGERRLVQLKAPPGSDFWRMIETYNDVIQRAQGQAGDASPASLESWRPVILMEKEESDLAPLPQTFAHPFVEPVGAAGDGG